jgi:hypothetical protein
VLWKNQSEPGRKKVPGDSRREIQSHLVALR